MGLHYESIELKRL